MESSEVICPSCGTWVEFLVDEVGWCITCTLNYLTDKGVCRNCGKIWNSRNGHGKLCGACKNKKFKEDNSERLEFYMAQGLTLTKSIELVRRELRPKCVVCGNPIKGGNRKNAFCRVNEECKKAYRKFDYLKYTKGLPEEQALERTLSELQIYRIRQNKSS